MGNIFRQAKDQSEGGIAFLDFRPYAPSNDAPASFIATPIFEEGKKVGVLAFQMPIDAINSIMSADAKLGETGETLLVGADRLMRNDSSFTKDQNDILTAKIEPSKASASDATGTLAGYRDDISSLSVSQGFSFHNTPYEVIAIQAMDEINAPLIGQRNATILITSLDPAWVLVIAAIFFSRSIANPIKLLVERARELANGNTQISFEGLDRQDEIGSIASAIGAFRNNVEEQNKLAKESEEATRVQMAASATG